MADRYLKRLARDLDRWISDGLVAAQNRQAILDSAAPSPRRWSAAGAAAILGAILLALAALSFVGANWSELPKIARFALILGALWASLGSAAAAFARGAPALGHALALLGAALFGAAIMLTAQTFNMSAFRNTGVLIWAAGALATALVIPSRPVLVLAAGVGALWAGLEVNNPLTPGPHWAYLALWFVTAAAALRMTSSVTLHLLAACLVFWIGHTLYETLGPDNQDPSFWICALSSLCRALWPWRPRWRWIAGSRVPACWRGGWPGRRRLVRWRCRAQTLSAATWPGRFSPMRSSPGSRLWRWPP